MLHKVLALIQATVEGDPAAWRELWRALEPIIWAQTGRYRLLGPLSRVEDERRSVVVAVMERLRADDFRRLRALHADLSGRDPVVHARQIGAWIATVAARVAIDHVRAHAEYRDLRARSSAGSRWVELCSLDEERVERPSRADPERAALALGLLERARRELTQPQLRALSAWLEGEDFATIAENAGMADATAAQRLVRSGLRRLRHAVASEREPRGEDQP